jgi:hypothetical protein
MRKHLIASAPQRNRESKSGRNWLELETAATVEVTSEAEGFPVEGALLSEGQRGWRAATPGTQTIRLLFDHPQTLRTIRLVFKEEESPRTQEFVLRWLPEGSGSWKDIVRQQWNFSPPDTAEECEEYKLELPPAAALELIINPDISHGNVRASLKTLQLSVQE